MRASLPASLKQPSHALTACVYLFQNVGDSAWLSQTVRVQSDCSERETHSRVWEPADKNERTVSERDRGEKWVHSET